MVSMQLKKYKKVSIFGSSLLLWQHGIYTISMPYVSSIWHGEKMKSQQKMEHVCSPAIAKEEITFARYRQFITVERNLFLQSNNALILPKVAISIRQPCLLQLLPYWITHTTHHNAQRSHAKQSSNLTPLKNSMTTKNNGVTLAVQAYSRQHAPGAAYWLLVSKISVATLARTARRRITWQEAMEDGRPGTAPILTILYIWAFT